MVGANGIQYAIRNGVLITVILLKPTQHAAPKVKTKDLVPTMLSESYKALLRSHFFLPFEKLKRPWPTAHPPAIPPLSPLKRPPTPSARHRLTRAAPKGCLTFSIFHKVQIWNGCSYSISSKPLYESQRTLWLAIFDEITFLNLPQEGRPHTSRGR
jgi:hypothetical protein